MYLFSYLLFLWHEPVNIHLHFYRRFSGYCKFLSCIIKDSCQGGIKVFAKSYCKVLHMLVVQRSLDKANCCPIEDRFLLCMWWHCSNKLWTNPNNRMPKMKKYCVYAIPEINIIYAFICCNHSSAIINFTAIACCNRSQLRLHIKANLSSGQVEVTSLAKWWPCKSSKAFQSLS